MPDAIFADPRLAVLYDSFDGDRRDLDLYAGIVADLTVTSVLDIGCGTGTFACRLAASGVEVVGVDPAAASLEVARGKPGGDRVRWIHGVAADVPALQADVVVMTGNVAQVFVSDDEWAQTLAATRNALRPDGWVVFEVRDPARRAWERWTPEHTSRSVEVPGVGTVTSRTELVSVDGPLITFRHRYAFDTDGSELTSTSTLRFREQDEIIGSLEAAGFRCDEIRDAPDRPGLEWVFVAQLMA